jgi:hypothetical protein
MLASIYDKFVVRNVTEKLREHRDPADLIILRPGGKTLHLRSARRKEIFVFETINQTGGALEVQERFRVFVLFEEMPRLPLRQRLRP